MRDRLRRFKAGAFQALSHPTRIAIVELLRDEGEVSVGTIYERLCIEQANASQHLGVLRAKQIVVGRKDGNQVFYSLRDPILGQVLDLMRQYFQSHLTESLEMLRDMEKDEAKCSRDCSRIGHQEVPAEERNATNRPRPDEPAQRL